MGSSWRWLVRRAVLAVEVVAAVVTLTFFAIRWAPGDPFLPTDERPLPPSVEAALRHRYGIDRPLGEQYLRYLTALSRGDLGESFVQHRPVSELIEEAIPHTILLAAAALAVDFGLGIVVGSYQAIKQDRAIDQLLTAISLVGYSLPAFWLGLVLVLVFGQWLHWFPVGGIRDPVSVGLLNGWAKALDRMSHLALPAFTLGMIGAAGTARYQRAAMVEALRRPFLAAARARGLPTVKVWWHALRTALLPAITLLGLSLPLLVAGSVVVESVFAWPGMGRLAAQAVASRDYPVVVATTLLASSAVVVGSLVADLMGHLADPRTRHAS